MKVLYKLILLTTILVSCNDSTLVKDSANKNNDSTLTVLKADSSNRVVNESDVAITETKESLLAIGEYFLPNNSIIDYKFKFICIDQPELKHTMSYKKLSDNKCYVFDQLYAEGNNVDTRKTECLIKNEEVVEVDFSSQMQNTLSKEHGFKINHYEKILLKTPVAEWEAKLNDDETEIWKSSYLKNYSLENEITYEDCIKVEKIGYSTELNKKTVGVSVYAKGYGLIEEYLTFENETQKITWFQMVTNFPEINKTTKY